MTDVREGVVPESSAGAGPRDVFLSYSRADLVRAQDLVARLEAAGRSVWVDWSGIPPTAEWMSEVESGIDACAGVVVLLSRSSIASEVCGREIAHAQESGKRVVPVALEDLDAAQVPDSVAHLNWVFARPSDDPDSAVARICEGLDLDLEQVHEHTRILVRSKEWQASGEDGSRLLRGAELAAAEAWLASATEDPRPTAGQRAYVVASRAQSTRRQRRLVAAVAVVAAASLVLAGFALIQRSAAQSAAARAQTQAASAVAVTELDHDPEVSLLMALEAARTGRTPQSDDALRRALLADHLVAVMRPEPNGEKAKPTVSLSYTSDGTRLLTLGNDGLARVWSTTDGRLLGSAPFEGDAFGAATAPGTSSVVTFSSQGVARVVDAAAVTVGPPLELAAPAASVEPGPTPGTVLLSLYDGTLHVVDVRTSAVGPALATEPAGVIDATLAPDGRTTAVAGPDGVVRIAAPGRPEAEVRHRGSTPFVARWSHDGSTVGIAWSNGDATLVDGRDGHELAVLTHDTPVTDLQWATDDSFVLTSDSSGVLRAWDPQSGRSVVELRGHTDYVSYVAVDPVGGQVASASDDGSARLWRLGGALPTSTTTTSRPAVGLALLPGGERAVVSQSDGTVELLDLAGWKVERVLDRSASGVPAVSPEGTLAAVVAVAPANEVRIVETSTGRVVHRITDLGTRPDPRTHETVTARPYSVAFAPDGRRLAVASGSSLRIVDVTSGAVTASTPLVEDFGLTPLEIEKDGDLARRTVTWLPDGSAVAVTAGPGARLWDPATGLVTRWFEGHDATAQGLAVDPSGTRLVTASMDKTARIYDVATGAQIAVLKGHSAQVLTAAFSPSGAHVVTSGLDGTVRVWDLSGTQLASYPVASLVASSARFLGDDSHLLVTSEEGANFTSDPVPDVQSGAVSLYTCEVCAPRDDLLALARQRATRALTAEEESTLLAEDVSASPTPRSTASATASALVGAWTFSATGSGGALTTQTLELRPSGGATQFGPDGFLEGTWEADGSTLTLHGLSVGCPEGDGRWTWTSSGGRVTITPAAGATATCPAVALRAG